MSVATVDPKHNVTGNRQAYYDKIGKYNMTPLWEVLRGLVTPEPKTKCVPKVWKFSDVKKAKLTMRDEMAKMGIDVRDPDQPVGTLSGGERQAVAIARAMYFDSDLIILDEPTNNLGVAETQASQLPVFRQLTPFILPGRSANASGLQRLANNPAIASASTESSAIQQRPSVGPARSRVCSCWRTVAPRPCPPSLKARLWNTSAVTVSGAGVIVRFAELKVSV